MDRAELIRSAFIEPIRSVMLIDDQFPTYRQLARGESVGDMDPGRAAALYSWFSSNGRRCDVENAPHDIDESALGRVTGADLIVLDYHLAPGGTDATDCLKLFKALNTSKHANLVILLTGEDDLEMVRRRCALALTGGPGPLPDEWVEIWEEAGKPEADASTLERHLADFLAKAAGQRSLSPATRPETATIVALRQMQREALDTSRSWGDADSPVVKLGLSPSGVRYLQSDNVFAVFVNKIGAEDEGKLIEQKLVECLEASQPSDFSCCLALARNEVVRLSHSTIRLEGPDDPDLEAGWWRYLLGTLAERQDGRVYSERVQRALDTFLDRLTARAARALPRELFRADISIDQIWDEVARRVPRWVGDEPGKTRALFALNEVLSRREPREFITAGTIVRLEDDNPKNPPKYLVCVSPACDMVPRTPDTTWTKKLHPWRPASFLALSVEDDIESALRDAEHGRHIFIKDSDRQLALRAVHPQSRAVQQEILLVQMEVQTEDNRFHVLAFGLEAKEEAEEASLKGQPKGKKPKIPGLKERRMLVVGQLAAPYAERMVQLLGNHLSRVGPDFLKDDRQAPSEAAPPKPDPA